MASTKRRSPVPNTELESASPTPIGTPLDLASSPEQDQLPTEEIARLAYSYWETRGGEGGSAEEDWLRAERELRSRNAPAKTMGSGGAA